MTTRTVSLGRRGGRPRSPSTSGRLTSSAPTPPSTRLRALTSSAERSRSLTPREHIVSPRGSRVAPPPLRAGRRRPAPGPLVRRVPGRPRGRLSEETPHQAGAGPPWTHGTGTPPLGLPARRPSQRALRLAGCPGACASRPLCLPPARGAIGQRDTSAAAHWSAP